MLGHAHGAVGEERCSALRWYPWSDDVCWPGDLFLPDKSGGWGERHFFALQGYEKHISPSLIDTDLETNYRVFP